LVIAISPYFAKAPMPAMPALRSPLLSMTVLPKVPVRMANSPASIGPVLMTEILPIDGGPESPMPAWMP